MNNNTSSMENTKLIIVDNYYSLNEEIINISNEPKKTEYYKKMFEKMFENLQTENKIIRESTTFFNKFTE